MPAKKQIAPELLAEGKFLYEQTLTSVEEIAARMGLSRATLYVRLPDLGWQRRRYSPTAAADESAMGQIALPDGASAPATPAEVAQVLGDADAVTVEKKAALFARAFRAAEAQMDAIEAAMKVLHAAPAPFERTARALAMLNRSLRDILVLTKADEAVLADEADNHAVSRDLESLRGELAQRLHALMDVQEASESRNPGEVFGGSEPQRS